MHASAGSISTILSVIGIDFMALTRSANLRFAMVVVALLGVGATMGYGLAGHERLMPYKLLNIAGIIYGLIGVLVLSEMVAKSDSLKKFMVHWVAGVLIWHWLLVVTAMAIAT